MTIKTKYIHVEKLALAVVQVVQRFRAQNHYHFRFQPYTKHPYQTIVGGEIIQMDSDSTGV
jgi:hypothetical protein